MNKDNDNFIPLCFLISGAICEMFGAPYLALFLFASALLQMIIRDP